MHTKRHNETTPSTKQASIALLTLIGLLAICNIAFIRSAGWAKLGWSIAGYAGLWLTYRLGGLSPADCGLQTKHIKTGLRYGGISILVILLGAFVLFMFDRHFFMDPRYHQGLAVALYASMVLLPLKTVVFEELAFRGLFLGIVLRLTHHRLVSVIVTSLAFGLWHVSSSEGIGSYHVSGGIVAPQLVVVLGAVCVTALASVALCELRLRSKSLVAPMIVHWFLNGFAIVLASLSWR